MPSGSSDPCVKLSRGAPALQPPLTCSSCRCPRCFRSTGGIGSTVGGAVVLCRISRTGGPHTLDNAARAPFCRSRHQRVLLAGAECIKLHGVVDGLSVGHCGT